MEKAINDDSYSIIDETHELWNLVKLLRECGGLISVSPGFAFSEMPPVAAADSTLIFDAFFKKYLPMYSDAPDSTFDDFSDEIEKTKGSFNYTYGDLYFRERFALGVSYASLLYLNYIERGFDTKPLNQYVRYLSMAEKKIDIIGAKESEIARFCLSPQGRDKGELADVRRKVRNNFIRTKKGKPPRTSKEMKAVAFNGARDLALINAANVADTVRSDGMVQDNWIATHDFKLADFASVFRHVEVDGEPGKGIEFSQFEEQCLDDYWEKTLNEFFRLSDARRSYNEKRRVQVKQVRKSVSIAEQLINTAFVIRLPSELDASIR